MPLLEADTEFAAKWSNLCEAHLEEGIHTPIIAFEFMNRFYVQEGNKRVSVLKYYGAVKIAGTVTRLIPERNDSLENRIYYEFLDFYRLSKVNDVHFSKPGSYAKLQTLVCKASGESWTDDDRMNFAAFYTMFCQQFQQLGGDRLNITAGDAMLVYLSVYRYSDACDSTPAQMKANMEKLWNEVRVLTEPQAVHLSLEPTQSTGEPLLAKLNIFSSRPSELKVVFLHEHNAENSAWVRNHDKGRAALEKEFPDRLSVTCRENVNPEVDAEQILEDVAHDNADVFIELKASSEDKLKELQADISMELTRSKISVDRLLLRQKEGFLSVLPTGNNVFASQFERVLPASSVANLYPLNYSGKTDENGFYIGRDKYGSNVLVDFDKRTEDKTNSNILILGNSGQGKSYLMKLLLCNQREAGKSVLVLDPEAEYRDICSNLGGTYIDMMSGEFMINPLEPKAWSDGEKADIEDPETFRKVTRLSQHISYLKDFFRAYKDFSDSEIDTIEIMLMKLYARFGIDDFTDFNTLDSEDYPIMSDLYELIEKEFMAFDNEKKHLYTEEMLQNICLGLHSMCKGAESKYFNGHTNINDSELICFGVKGLMDTNKRLKDTLLFNILSYMSNQLLGRGNTVAAVDELYLFLTNMTAIEYIRNGMKRVRKKESSFILASQNIEDFLLPEIKEFTKPLFSIPSHHFLFNPGNISPTAFIDTLQLEESEYGLIKYPERGTCLYRCGNERYLLQVIAPQYKAVLFGNGGGR